MPGDPIVGYISLGKGHHDPPRATARTCKALRRTEERFTPVEWNGEQTKSFRVQIAVSSWDRPRLLEDVARTFAEHGANIVSYGGVVEDQLAKNWYTAEVGDIDVAALAPDRAALGRRGLRRLPRHAGDPRLSRGGLAARAGRRQQRDQDGLVAAGGELDRPDREAVRPLERAEELAAAVDDPPGPPVRDGSRPTSVSAKRATTLSSNGLNR